MINLINSIQAKKLDKDTIISSKITNLELIDNAGKQIAYHIIENIPHPFNKKFLCIAGYGNNGLDSIVCNYYLNLNNILSELLIINASMIDYTYLKEYVTENRFFTQNDKIKINESTII